MAAPTPTARQTPAGRMLSQGYKTVICFSADPNCEFYEISVTPFGMDSGAPIENTTMWTGAVKTKAPSGQIEVTDASAEVGYDPVMLDSALALIGQPGSVTIHFPDHSSWCAWGYLSKFQPSALERGKEVRASITIVITNLDPVTCDVALPVYTAGSGTGACS